MVRKLVYSSLAVAAGVGLLASAALAGHNEPSKAKAMKMELVTAYQACTSANSVTLTSAIPFPACTPPVRGDSVCGFGPKGKGLVKAVVLSKDLNKDKALDPVNDLGDIKVIASIKDITDCGTCQGTGDAGEVCTKDNDCPSGERGSCVGETLTLVASARVTADDCPPGTQPDGSCTLVDIPDFPIGACQVSKGKCKIKGTVNGFFGGNLFNAGLRAGVEILGCGVLHGSNRLFSCGLLIP